jgi:hypothetical protein
VQVEVRARAAVNTVVELFVSGRPAGDFIVRRRLWDRYRLTIPAGLVAGPRLELGLSAVARPLVRRQSVEAETLVDYVEVTDPEGFVLAPEAAVLAGSVPLALFLFSLAVGGPPAAGLAAAAVGAGSTLALARLAPLSLILAIPRLLPVALACGLLVRVALSRSRHLTPRERVALSWLVVVGLLFHGALPFFPNHNPPNLETHISRALDLGSVPLDYGALMRYSSQLPTESQTSASAIAHFGEETLVPYPPSTYLILYGLRLLGVDLHWAMTVATAAVLMAVAPGLWYVCARLWNRSAAWIAALLYVLDLAVWHHVGRSDSPSSFGVALATCALLYLALEAGGIDRPRRVAGAAAALALAALSYSAIAILLGLFGVALLALLALDARTLPPPARKGLAGALVMGGLMAGGLFYFHYLPGIFQGAAVVEAGPDLFPGRTFFIFHNESRQVMRIWRLGLWLWVPAGLAAAPFALRRAFPPARAILLSWFVAWLLIMLLKEPFLFPKLLRWAKEEQFLSPLLCLLIGGAVGTVRRPYLRWCVAGLALLAALGIEVRDFLLHANSLSL